VLFLSVVLTFKFVGLDVWAVKLNIYARLFLQSFQILKGKVVLGLFLVLNSGQSIVSNKHINISHY